MQKLVLKDGVNYVMGNGISISGAITVLNRVLIHQEKGFYNLHANIYVSEANYNADHSPIDSFTLVVSFAQVAAIEAQMGESFLVSDGNGGMKINDVVLPTLLILPNPDDSIEELIGERWEIG